MPVRTAPWTWNRPNWTRELMSTGKHDQPNPASAWGRRLAAATEIVNRRCPQYMGLLSEDPGGPIWTIRVHPDHVPTMMDTRLRLSAPGDTAASFRADLIRDDRRNVIPWYATRNETEDSRSAEALMRATLEMLANGLIRIRATGAQG